MKQRKRNENYELRIYLKGNTYIYLKNWTSGSTGCIKSYSPDTTVADAGTAARCTMGVFRKKILSEMRSIWGLTKEQFIEKYLVEGDKESGYQTKNVPCDFLGADGKCCVGDCRPESCKKYPYTDQPDRWASLYSVLDVIEVCPVAFEIYERLKIEYGWRYRR